MYDRLNIIHKRKNNKDPQEAVSTARVIKEKGISFRERHQLESNTPPSPQQLGQAAGEARTGRVGWGRGSAQNSAPTMSTRETVPLLWPTATVVVHLGGVSHSLNC